MSVNTRTLSLLIGAVLLLFCAGSVFAGQPKYKLFDPATEPEAPLGRSTTAPLTDCFFGDQSLCDHLSQNVDETFTDVTFRCAADEADLATGYWRLFDLDQDDSVDDPVGIGFHGDVNGTVVTGEFCIGQVNYFVVAKHINDQDNEQDGPGGDDFDPENPVWDDTEGPTKLTVKASCLDEGLPFEQAFLDPPTVVGPFTVDCGGNPGTLEFGPQGKKWDEGGVPADPDGFECFLDPVSTKIKHCCDADTEDLAIELLTQTCCNGGDNGFGGQICSEDTDGDGASDIVHTSCEMISVSQNQEGETVPGYLGGDDCLPEPVSMFLIVFGELHTVLTVDEFIEPIPATNRLGGLLLVGSLLLGSWAYFFIRRRRGTH